SRKRCRGRRRFRAAARWPRVPAHGARGEAMDDWQDESIGWRRPLAAIVVVALVCIVGIALLGSQVSSVLSTVGSSVGPPGVGTLDEGGDPGSDTGDQGAGAGNPGGNG